MAVCDGQHEHFTCKEFVALLLHCISKNKQSGMNIMLLWVFKPA